MDKLVTATTTVPYAETANEQEFQLAWRVGEKIKTGVYVYMTPVIDADVGVSEGSLTGGTTFDEEDEPQYIEWSGTRYGLSVGNVDVKAVIFKLFSGQGSSLTVDEDKLEITSKYSFIGIVKITKNNQSKRYLWKPPNIDEETTAILWAFYEGTHPVTKKSIKSMAFTEISWPPENEQTYPISLSVGKQDNEEGCIWIYQTPNSSAVERGTNLGRLTDDSIVKNKAKDIYTVWNGTSLSLPDGCVSCSVNVYKIYSGTPGGIFVNLGDGVATTEESWNGIVKLTTVTESRKLKWEPPDVEERVQAVVHAYRKGTISMVNVEWKPNESDYTIRLELGQRGSKEGTDLPLKEIKIRMYPPLDEAVVNCTVGSITRRNKILEDKEQYLEFQLVELPDVNGTDEIVWEHDDPIDANNVSKVSLGRSLSGVSFEPLDCYDRSGVPVSPEVTYDEESGNAIGDISFYGLVKVIYQEEYQELVYQQAYFIKDNGVLSIQDGYVYARLGEKVTYLEVPWNTNMTNDKKELYWIFSYYVRAVAGTFEYPDNWLAELESETLYFDQKTYSEWEALLDSRDTGTFAKDDTIKISPGNCVIEERVHRTASYDFLGNLFVDNAQPIYGTYYKPYTDVTPGPDSSYKPKYFLLFAEKPQVYDGRDEFGEEGYIDSPDYTGQGSLYIPSDDSTEALKKAWEGAYMRFNQDKIYESLLTEFPGLVRIPAKKEAP